MLLLEDKRFYVYVYLDTRKPGKYKYGEYEFEAQPFYVGKGHYSRDIFHLTACKEYDCFFYRKLLKILDINKLPIIKRIKDHITDRQALDFEKELIKIIGRIIKNEGPLTNISAGGDGYSLIKKPTTKFSDLWKNDEYREKIIDGSRNNWKIIDPNKNEILIRDLSKWCKNNNFDYSSAKASSKTMNVCRGFCFINLDKNPELTIDNFVYSRKHENRKHDRTVFRITFLDGTIKYIYNLGRFCSKNELGIVEIENAIKNDTLVKGLFKIERVKKVKTSFRGEDIEIKELRELKETTYCIKSAAKLLNIPHKTLMAFNFEKYKIKERYRIKNEIVEELIKILSKYKTSTQICMKYKIHNLKLCHWEHTKSLVSKVFYGVKMYEEQHIEQILMNLR